MSKHSHIERKVRISQDAHPRLFSHLTHLGPKALTHEMFTLMEFGLIFLQTGASALGNTTHRDVVASPELSENVPVENGMDDSPPIDDFMGGDGFDLGDAILMIEQ